MDVKLILTVSKYSSTLFFATCVSAVKVIAYVTTYVGSSFSVITRLTCAYKNRTRMSMMKYFDISWSFPRKRVYSKFSFFFVKRAFLDRIDWRSRGRRRIGMSHLLFFISILKSRYFPGHAISFYLSFIWHFYTLFVWVFNWKISFVLLTLLCDYLTRTEVTLA